MVHRSAENVADAIDHHQHPLNPSGSFLMYFDPAMNDPAATPGYKA